MFGNLASLHLINRAGEKVTHDASTTRAACNIDLCLANFHKFPNRRREIVATPCFIVSLIFNVACHATDRTRDNEREFWVDPRQGCGNR